MAKNAVPVWNKYALTLDEAALYFGIGKNRLREMTDSQNNPYVIWVGNKRLIKRESFEKYLETLYCA